MPRLQKQLPTAIGPAPVGAIILLGSKSGSLETGMKATTLAVTISVLASAGLAIVAACDMTAWNRARAKEAGSPNGPAISRSMRDGDQYQPATANP